MKNVPFSDDVINQAWERSGGRCECTRNSHDHEGRCPQTLIRENQGRRGYRGAWEAHHIESEDSGGPNTLSNCEILCWNCHAMTFS